MSMGDIIPLLLHCLYVSELFLDGRAQSEVDPFSGVARSYQYKVPLLATKTVAAEIYIIKLTSVDHSNQAIKSLRVTISLPDRPEDVRMLSCPGPCPSFTWLSCFLLDRC